MALYSQLLTLLMDWTSPLGPVATLFQSGILLLVRQSATHLKGKVTLWSVSLAPLLGTISSLVLMAGPSICGTHFHTLPFNFPSLVMQFKHILFMAQPKRLNLRPVGGLLYVVSTLRPLWWLGFTCFPDSPSTISLDYESLPLDLVLKFRNAKPEPFLPLGFVLPIWCINSSLVITVPPSTPTSFFALSQQGTTTGPFYVYRRTHIS